MVLDIIENSFGLMKKKPKVILPHFLSWIPVALFGVIFYFAFLDAMKVGLSNLTTPFIISLMIKYAAPFTAAVILSYLVTAYIQVIYPDIIRQAFAGKNISLGHAFAVAKPRFWSMVWTDFVVMLLMTLVILGIAGISVVFSSLPLLSGILMLVLIIIVGAAFIYIVPGFYMLSTVVALENLSGLRAIRRSFALSKGRILSIWGVVFLLMIFSFAIGALQAVPLIGIVLTLPINAFVSAWAVISQTTYYFMRVKNAKPKL